MKSTLKVDMVISTDADQKNILWKESDATLNTIVRTDLVEQSSGVAVVAAGGTFVVPMGGVAWGKMLFVSSDAEIEVTINGAATPISVVPLTTYRGVLALHGAFTSVSIEAVAAANVRYCVAGL